MGQSVEYIELITSNFEFHQFLSNPIFTTFNVARWVLAMKNSICCWWIDNLLTFISTKPCYELKVPHEN